MLKTRKLITAVALMFAVAVPVCAQQKIVLKWGEQNAPTDIMAEGAMEFAKIVKEKSKDRIEIAVYLSSQLGDEKTQIQSVQMGALDFFRANSNITAEFGADKSNVHLEVFQSLDSDPFAAVVLAEDDSDEGPATAIVTLDGETHELQWPRKAVLLDVLLDKGLDAPFSCREGHCGACAVLMKKGDVDMAINDVLEPSDLEEGLILGCQAVPKTDSVEVTYDE